MKTVTIGATKWAVSNVALGTMRMSRLTVDQTAAALLAAKEAGINYIDSADIYGDGQAERNFAAAMKVAGLDRDAFYIQSKAGIVLDRKSGRKRYDFSKQHLLAAVDGILGRLGTDYLDTLLLHRPDALMEVDEVAAVFDQLQASGKVRHFGVSNFTPGQLALLQEGLSQRLLINQVQFSLAHTGMLDAGFHANLATPAALDHDGGILEDARRRQLTIQTWSPFQQGLFGGTFINDEDHYGPLNQQLATLAAKYGVSKNAIAVAWLLRYPDQVQLLLGTITPAHILDSARGSDLQLTRQEWYDLYVAAGNDLP